MEDIKNEKKKPYAKASGKVKNQQILVSINTPGVTKRSLCGLSFINYCYLYTDKRATEGCSVYTIHCKPCSRSPIHWDQEVNLFNRNNFKAIIYASCTENMELADRFIITAHGSPSGTVYKNFKPFEIILDLS